MPDCAKNKHILSNHIFFCDLFKSNRAFPDLLIKMLNDMICHRTPAALCSKDSKVLLMLDTMGLAPKPLHRKALSVQTVKKTC